MIRVDHAGVAAVAQVFGETRFAEFLSGAVADGTLKAEYLLLYVIPVHPTGP